MSINHYENFPVGSIFLPKKYRWPIHIIYRFARTADDFVDEGNLSKKERILLLKNYSKKINDIRNNKEKYEDKLFQDLSLVIKKFHIPINLFEKLLKAFKQDIEKRRYEDFNEIINYCNNSANPIGRILLTIFNENSEENIDLSDKICSSLQLINFLQDIYFDFHKRNRIYLPMMELKRFNINEKYISNKKTDAKWREFYLFQVKRTREILLSGEKLGSFLKGRIGLEIRMIIKGAHIILDKLEKSKGEIYEKVPKLSKVDWLKIIVLGLLK